MITIRSWGDGEVVLSSVPSLDVIAERVREATRSSVSHAEVYALTVANHLREQQQKLIGSLSDGLVVIELKDEAGGRVSAVFTPRAAEIYQRNRDSVLPISQADQYALAAIEALKNMDHLASLNIPELKQ